MLMTVLAVTLMSLGEPDTIFVVDTLSKYDSIVSLEDVKITGSSEKEFKITSSQNKVQVNRDYLESHFSGSLVESLEEIPGVKAMTIGSGQSKPTIRGMGFNRMAVTENGIKHEGQQWGDDHGLEIDQFSIDRAEVIKGPSALMYGSDAIGGVLNLYSNYAPVKDFEANITLNGHSNNQQMGLAAKLGGRAGKFFYKAGLSVSDYADFKVPADSIQYYSYWIKLKDQRLRNTAGKEQNFNAMFGYIGKNFHTDIRLSDDFSKSGFFADAHGLEVRLSQIDYNRSIRDIDVPYAQVNHLKIQSHTVWNIKQYSVESNAAFQNNLRQEHSEPLSHGYMPTPDGTLERKFDKNTYSLNLKIMRQYNNHSLSAGINTDFQHNKREGWGFIIPDFDAFSIGSYLFDKYSVNANLSFNAGIRYDYSAISIGSYTDWYKTPVNGTDSVYKQRSEDITKSFNAFTWSLGTVYSSNQWIFKANIGKSFRTPIAKELGADGINYHIFRYEKGNKNLSAEESYQLDCGINYDNGVLNIQIDPYLNYFPNYIYLNPTSVYTEGLQTYFYTQSEVLRCGFEIQSVWKITEKIESEIKGEYLYSEQLSGDKKGYCLPFSTPCSMETELKYTFGKRSDGYIKLGLHVTGRQNNIVPPEKTTPGYCIVNAGLGKHFTIGKNTIKITLGVKNILNKRYYDHTSYYRLIDVPQQGRNFSLVLSWDF